jgi:hypothetical protein
LHRLAGKRVNVPSLKGRRKKKACMKVNTGFGNVVNKW